MTTTNTTQPAAQFLTPADLASRWGGGVTTTTLANWRTRKMGPDYTKMGAKVLYPLDAVLAYEAANQRKVA